MFYPIRGFEKICDRGLNPPLILLLKGGKSPSRSLFIREMLTSFKDRFNSIGIYVNIKEKSIKGKKIENTHINHYLDFSLLMSIGKSLKNPLDIILKEIWNIYKENKEIPHCIILDSLDQLNLPESLDPSVEVKHFFSVLKDLKVFALILKDKDKDTGGESLFADCILSIKENKENGKTLMSVSKIRDSRYTTTKFTIEKDSKGLYISDAVRCNGKSLHHPNFPNDRKTGEVY